MSQSDDTIDPLCYTAADEAESPTGGGADTVVADDGQLLPAAVPLQPIERYDVIEVIASGGMGTVWLARDKLLERDVALKILHRTLEGSPKARQRFEAEARLTGRLDHPGIVPVYDCGRLESGRWYFAMRRIHGVDLREHIDSFRADGQKEYPLNALLRLFSQVCLIVAYAHDRGCVHRDLKPANILVGAYGELYVADWGIAKVVRDAAIDNSSQKDGVDVPRDEHGIVGTAKYMSPEHVLVGSVELTAKSDVFSLGIMLVELVTGRFPFAGQNGVELMQAIVDGERVDTPSMSNGQAVPDLLRELFDDVLAPDPTARPTAVELAARIGEYLDGVEDRRRAVARHTTVSASGWGFSLNTEMDKNMSTRGVMHCSKLSPS